MIRTALTRLASSFALVLSVSATAQTIDNLSGWNGASGFAARGTGALEHTWGQTFVAPTDPYLKSWKTFFRYGIGNFTYRFYIAPWDDANVRLLSAPVFSSGDLQSLDPSSQPQWVSVEITTDTLLRAGASYIAFTSTSAFPGQQNGSAGMAQAGFFAEAEYAQDGFVRNASSSFANLSVDGWLTNRADQSWDTAFRAEFHPVPEPTSVIALGIGALALTARRRKS